MQEFERPEYIFEEESEHIFLMLRLLTILSMPQTTVERFGLLCLLQHVEESPFYNFVHNLQIGQYMLLAFGIFLRSL